MLNQDYGIPNYDAVGGLQGQPANTNLTAPTNFKLLIPKIPNTQYFCTSVSVPGQSCDPMVYKTRGLTLRVPGNSVVHGDLTFSFLVDEKMKNITELQNWFKTMLAFKDTTDLVTTANWLDNEAQLIFLNNKKTPVRRMTFRGAFPVLLSGITFKATDTDATFMVATCTLSYTYYNLEQL